MSVAAVARHAPRAPLPVGPVAGCAVVGAAAVATVALPLLVYTASLAFFGIAHVLSELHYIDRRFSARLGGGALAWLGVPIAMAVAALAAGFLGLGSPRVTGTVELAAATALAFGAAGLMRRKRVAGAVIGVALAAGALAAPFQLLLTLAVLHNFTPLGFFAEALSGAARRRTLAALALPLIAVPLVIATGLPFAALARLGWALPDAGFLASGPLALNLGVYVPPELAASDWALHAFTAAVFAQITHYAVVIGLLPRLLDGAPPRTVARWPAGGRLVAAIAATAAGFALRFVLDYRLARELYALAALAHGWAEIPILLLAWGGFVAAQPARA